MFLRLSTGLLCLRLGLQTLPLPVFGAALQPRADAVDWQSCGEGFHGFQCANVSVPLDHHNASDPRTMSIAVTRFLATDEQNRQGSVFINPGGPGGSGTLFALQTGPALSVVLKGQYDIVGFDPRGVNQTSPHVSCFNSQQDQDAFRDYTNSFQLNLPGNVTASIESNVKSQVSQFNSDLFALAAHCYDKTGDAIAYMGTEAVVRDIDFLSKKIEGADVRINYWGFSYGTIIGQYMVKILHPDRLGRIIIDGVLDADEYNQYGIDSFNTGPLDMSNAFRVFASTCLSAGANCSLNAFSFSSADELLNSIDQTVDALYENPVPVYDLDQPVVATASDLRSALGGAMYSINSWPSLAEGLALALTGNFTPILSIARPWLFSNGDPPVNSPYAQNVISCDDSKPYDNTRLAPTTGEMTQSVLRKASEFPSWGNQWFISIMFCHAWETTPSRSRYNGTFELKNGTLATPILILSNTVDPVTPLVSAQAALSRLGDNARLIQQVDGYGHCAISDVSYCTLLSVTEYMVNGTLPGDSYTRCEVDQHPWLPFDGEHVLSKRQALVDDVTKAAWRELSGAVGAVVRR